MHLTVIIPTFNGAQYLAEQLEALAHQSSASPFEVIISDNGSTDATCEIAAGYLGRIPGLRLIDSSRRRGRSYARNAGAEAAAAEALAFCDQDDVVGEAWVWAMESALEKYDFVTGPIESKMLNEPWRIQHSVYPEQECYVHRYPPYLAHAPATNLGVKRSLHQGIGGFDEALMLAWEDSDYAFRIQLAGTKLHFAPDAIIHYRLRHDFASIYRQAKAYGEGNVAFYKKYVSMAKVEESWKIKASAWLSLLRPKALFGLWKKSTRALWLSRLGWQVGHLEGCVKYCILAPLFWM
jgi:GT2 family glycosyltransferase